MNTTYLVIGWTNGEAIHEEYSPDEYLSADIDYENCCSDPMIDACAIIRVESDLYSYIEYTEF